MSVVSVMGSYWFQNENIPLNKLFKAARFLIWGCVNLHYVISIMNPMLVYIGIENCRSVFPHAYFKGSLTKQSFYWVHGLMIKSNVEEMDVIIYPFSKLS